MRSEVENSMQVHIQMQPMQADACATNVALPAFAYNRVQFIKEQLLEQHGELHGLKASELDLVYDGTVLTDGKMLLEYGVNGSAEEPSVIKFAVQSPSSSAVGLSSDPLVDGHCPGMKVLVEAAMAGMLRGFAPALEEHSTGGTYRLFGPQKEPVAVLKPCDEEAFAPLNPRTYVGPYGSPGIVPGTYSGTGAFREVAAYALDHEHFAQVPMTTLVQVRHPRLNNAYARSWSEPSLSWKSASLQEFVSCAGHAGDYNPRFFSAPAVQRIAILDIRLVNLDRNDGNLLVRTQPGTASPSSSSPSTLIPIDHGACLPDAVGATADSIVWMSWPQAKEPFGPAELEYIRTLDLDKDLAFLGDVLGIETPCLRLAWATTRLLQIAADSGWSAYDVGQVMYRTDFDAPSRLEGILSKCAAASSALSSPDMAPLCLESGLTLSPLGMELSPLSLSPTISLRVEEFDSPDHNPRFDPFPSLSLSTDTDKEKAKDEYTSTPSTRASSPMTAMPTPVFDLPVLKDFDDPFENVDRAAESALKTKISFSSLEMDMFGAGKWPASRTKLFRQKVEEALMTLCRSGLH